MKVLKSKNLVYFFIFLTILGLMTISGYRTLNFSDYNNTFLKDKEAVVTDSQRVCNLTYEDISPNYEYKYPNFKIIQNANNLDLISNPKNIICIGTISFVEILDSGKEINFYIGTNTTPVNVLSAFLLVLYLLRSKKKLKRIDFLLLYIFHFIIFRYFYSIAEIREILIFSTSRVLMFYIVDYLFRINLYERLNTKISDDYRKEVDGLRALSVIIVIINHINKDLLPFGYLGVDIFFVLSGYVITASLLQNNNKKLGIFLKNFYLKRFKRIFPTLFLVVVSTFILFSKIDYYFLSTFITGLFSLIGLSNLYLYNISLDYFSTAAKYSPLLHTWSLGIEEQFYLIYPLIIFFLFHSVKKPAFLKIFLIMVFSFSIVHFLLMYNENFSGAYFLTTSRIWQILLGCLILLFKTSNNKKYIFIDNGTIPLLILFLYIIYGPNFQVNPHVTISIITSIFLLSTSKNSLSYKLLSKNFATNIGLLSYGLYLWHLPILTLKYWSDNYSLKIEEELLIIISLTLLTFLFFDVPIRVKNVFNIYSKIRIVTLLITLSVTLLILVNPFESKSIQNSETNQNTPIYKLVECHLPEGIDNVLSKCVSFTPGIQDILLMGDSHITNHYFATKGASKSNNVSLFTDWSIIGDFTGIDLCFGNRVCNVNGFDDYLKLLKINLEENDIVVLGFSSSRFTTSNVMQLEKKLNDLITVIDHKNSTLILVDDIPNPCKGININYELEVLVKKNYRICQTRADFSMAQRGVYSKAIQLVENSKSVIYVDPHNEMCRNEVCNLSFQEALLYADTSPHLTISGSNQLIPFWESVFQDN